VILQGPGRFGLRRAAVTRAGEELTGWADNWRPYLPSLPVDPRRFAAHAGRSDDHPGLWRAFDAAACRTAAQAHPEQAALQTAAAAARDAHEQAAHAREAGRREQSEMVSRFGRVAQTADPAAALADVDRKITEAHAELVAARARIARLTGEPALRGQPRDRIDQERDAWRARRDADHHERPRTTPRPPDPSIGRLHPHVHDRGRSAGRSPSIGR
jgi:exodeoxyribonuclease V alpha subunit